MREGWKEYVVPGGSIVLGCLLTIVVGSSSQSVAALRVAQDETGHQCCHQAVVRRGANAFVHVTGEDSNGREAWSITVLSDSNGSIQVAIKAVNGIVNGRVLRNGCTLRFIRTVPFSCKHFAEISEDSEILSSWDYSFPPTIAAGPIQANKGRVRLHSKTTSVLQSDLAGPIEKEALAKASVHHNRTTGFSISISRQGPEITIPFELVQGHADADFDNKSLFNAGHPFDEFCIQRVQAQIDFYVSNDNLLFRSATLARANAIIEGPFMKDFQEPVYAGFSTAGEAQARNVIIVKFDCHSPERRISVPRDTNVEEEIRKEILRHSRAE